MADAATTDRARPRLSRAEREERMLDAGERIFSSSGFRSSSMEAIAEASGITKALLYQYFDSKENFYLACLERARARFFEHLEEAAAAAPNPAERIRVVVTAYFDYLEEHRGVRWILYGDATMDRVNEMRLLNAQVLSRMIRADLVAAGVDFEEADVELLGHLIVGAGEQVGRWWLERPELPKAVVIERFTRSTQAAIAGVLG